MVGAMGTDGRSEIQVPSEAGCARICALNLVFAGADIPLGGQAPAQLGRWDERTPTIMMRPTQKDSARCCLIGLTFLLQHNGMQGYAQQPTVC